jgi:hypothetical protein
MNDDGLDRVVIPEFLQLPDNGIWVNDDAFEIYDSDLVSKAVNGSVLISRMKRQIDQREDGKHEEEESPSADQNPKQGARTTLFIHTDGVV